MVSRVLSYRNPLKRKGDANKTSSTPTKKARLVLIKELAKIYENDKIKNKINLNNLHQRRIGRYDRIITVITVISDVSRRIM